MKSKAVTYLLLAVVALVWGLIVWKIMSHFDEDTEEQANFKPKKSVLAVEDHHESNELYLNYPDPFLRGNTSGIQERGTSTQVFNTYSTTPKTHKNTKAVSAKNAIEWGFIKYSGLIGNKASTKKIALVYIHDKEYIVKQKDIVEGVTFLKISRDSLKVSFEGNKHVYLRGK